MHSDSGNDPLRHSVEPHHATTRRQARQGAEQALVVTEDELCALQERIDRILESIHDGFAVLDGEWRFVQVNARALEILRPVCGSRDGLIGHSHWDVFPELRGTDVERVYRRAVAEAATAEVEAFYPSLARWFEVRACPSGDGLTLFFHDVTRRKDAEDLLASEKSQQVTLDAKVAERTAQLAATNAQLVAEAENRERAEGSFRLLVEGVVDYAIYMLDPKGVITNWNTGAERIKGYASGEIVGQNYSRFFTDEDRAVGIPAMALAKAAAAGKYEAEGWRLRKDGTRFWASIVLDAIRDSEGHLLGFAKITRDITERRDAALALQRTHEQLAQAQKMEAIGQLTGGIAHDFNNLLQVIIGNLEALRRRNASGDGDSQRMIAAAVRGAESAATLTNRLLAFARRQPLNPKPIDVNTLVSGMSEMLHSALGETITIETVLPGGIWRVAADANQLENSLLNLAVNARDAMPSGGRLTIATANMLHDDAYANANGTVAGPYVMIAVGDTGTGMDADVQKTAFEPFFTTKDVGKGSGLGLSQVYGFITQSGGHVRICSETGEGTTVKLYLPRLMTKDEVSAPLPRDLPVGNPDRLILVVEDDTDVREQVVSMLGELHYSVLEAADGTSALQMLEANPAVQLLFTDVGLPGGMSGRELADTARAARPTLRVLFTTGYARHAIVHQGRRETGVDLLPKPFTYAALARKIHQLFDGADRDGTLPPA